MGIDFSDADGIDPELLAQAQDGEKLMKSTTDKGNAVISPETVNRDGGDQKSFGEVLESSKKNMNIVDKVISQGGFAGEDKDKYDLSQAYIEWIKSRNRYIKCPDEIIKTSVRYTSLVNGKADQNEIIKAHRAHLNTTEMCDKSSNNVVSTANKYFEVDRRVRENRLKSQNTYQGFTTMDPIVEKFQTRGSVVEGFNYYNTEDSYIDNSMVSGTLKYNQRLPRYAQSNKKESDDNKSTLPWNQYYSQCSDSFCENAHGLKDQYIKSINTLFDRAEEKLKLYQSVINMEKTSANSETKGSTTSKLDDMIAANNGSALNTVLENQKKDIAIYKQQALYNYDQYNSLSFIEDMIIFVYYAMFVIFVVFSLREYFSPAQTYDKKNIIILILLGIYPKYILVVVIWLLNVLTEITRMLGLKNVSFWY